MLSDSIQLITNSNFRRPAFIVPLGEDNVLSRIMFTLSPDQMFNIWCPFASSSSSIAQRNSTKNCCLYEWNSFPCGNALIESDTIILISQSSWQAAMVYFLLLRNQHRNDDQNLDWKSVFVLLCSAFFQLFIKVINTPTRLRYFGKRLLFCLSLGSSSAAAASCVKCWKSNHKSLVRRRLKYDRRCCDTHFCDGCSGIVVPLTRAA